jgi:hypothetical protein
MVRRSAVGAVLPRGLTASISGPETAQAASVKKPEHHSSLSYAQDIWAAFKL